MKTIPNKGDYVRIKNLNADEYTIAGRAFIDSGFDAGTFQRENYNSWIFIGEYQGKILHADNTQKFTGRELTIADLLGSEEEEYVPKVNEQCEFATLGYEHGEWKPITPRLINKHFVIFDYGNGEGDCFMRLDHFKFRPIKSDREVAIENIIEVISSAKTVSSGYRQIAESIYDAGWRKV